MHIEVPELDHKRPFYYDLIEGQPFTPTSASSRTFIQIELLLIFLKRGGNYGFQMDIVFRWQC